MANFNLCLEDYHHHLHHHQYCGSPVSVPFIWESQPGTPKFSSSKNTPLPPLTPPPSYFSRNPTKNNDTIQPSKSRNSNFFTNIFLRPRRSRIAANSSPASSSLSPSSSIRLSGTSFSGTSSPVVVSRLTGRSPVGTSPRKSFDYSSRIVMDDEEEHEHDSPVSENLGFRVGQGGSRRSSGCYTSMIKMLIA
ncbi:hypothetical protein M5689_016255 [Euphorbia peplus]|nr:hypothetical protein M5689_016255 [Euphorbia peplus]